MTKIATTPMYDKNPMMEPRLAMTLGLGIKDCLTGPTNLFQILLSSIKQ